MSDVARLIKLLPWLAANNGATVSDVSRHFGIPRRKVLDLLETVRWTGRGEGYGEYVDIEVYDGEYISVRDTQRLDRPVRLDSREASALVAGLQYLAEVPVQADADDVRALLDKLTEVLPASPPAITVVTPDEEQATIATIRQALEQQSCCRITYASAGATRSASRVIEPRTMTSADDRTTVHAWCREAQDVRSFRTDRIVAIELLDEPVSKQQDEHDSEDPYAGWLEVDMTVGVDHIGDFDPDTIVSRQVEGMSVRVTAKVANLDWLAAVVLAAGGHIHVHSPVGVYDVMERMAEAWRAANPPPAMG